MARLQTPVGRILSHALFNPVTKGFEGGDIPPQYYVKIAFAKNDPAWPAFRDVMLAEARKAYPSLVFSVLPNGGMSCNLPDFGFKVIDGDSANLDASMKAPKDKPGHPGCWVVKFTTGFPTPVVNSQLIAIGETDAKCGYYYKLNCDVTGGGQKKPGLYLNLNGTMLVREGEIIVYGQTVEEMFGSAPAPQYQQPTPPPATGAPLPPPPATDILQPLPPPPAGPQMAPGCPYTYDQLKVAGYSEAQMKSAGYLL